MRYARELLTALANGPLSLEAAQRLYPDFGAFQNGMMDAVTTEHTKLYAADSKELEPWQWLGALRDAQQAEKLSVAITENGRKLLREMSGTRRYRFHEHKAMPKWRLVIRDDLGFPAETASDAWTITREREEVDVNADVREEIAARGYCLFKIGANFADLDREMQPRSRA